jgi:hypothetical protein
MLIFLDMNEMHGLISEKAAGKIVVKAFVFLMVVFMVAGEAFANDDFSLVINCKQDSMTQKVTLTVFINPPQAAVSYNVDNEANVTLPSSLLSNIEGHYIYTVTLPHLTEGFHVVNVYALNDGFSRFANQTFTVDNTPVPTQSNHRTPILEQPPNFLWIDFTAVGITIIAIIIAAMLLLHNKIKKIK